MAADARTNAAGEVIPLGVTEIDAPHPLEISGVASVPDGYAVVGDEEPRHGWIWPLGLRFEIPGKLKGPESIAIATDADGRRLWLVLGEKKRKVVDFDGGSFTLSKDFAEEAGRGLEGLTVRWRDGAWQVAVCWEGGFYDWKSARKGEFARPRIALLTWQPGEKRKGEPDRVFELDVAEPSDGQRFRAPDLAWYGNGDGDDLLVLLASTDKKRKIKKHTWLQRFDLGGRRVGHPLRLEDQWGPYREDKNWEALDRTLDGTGVVMGYDERDPNKHRALAVFPYP